MSLLPTKSGTSVAGQLFDPSSQRASTDTGSDTSSTGTPSPKQTTGSGKGKKGSAKTKQDDGLIDSGLEAPPTATATPYRLPSPSTAPSTLSASDLAIAPNSKVASKSITSDNGTTQVAIEATTTASPRDTVAYYQGVFTSLGLTGASTTAAGGETSIAFIRGRTSVTVTVAAHDKGSHYVIFGVLRPNT